MKKTHVILLAIIFCPLFMFSQGNNWKINGNNNTNPINNFIGTTNNFGLSFRTFNIERLHINENTGTTAGFVGIGTNLPQSQLHINDGTYATFQMTNATTGANANDGFKLAVNNQNQALKEPIPLTGTAQI